MTMTTLETPATGNTKLFINGHERGVFLIHANLARILIDDDEIRPWSVTHIKSGARFPWSFLTQEAAEAFADDVLPLMKWEDVATDLPADSMRPTTVWKSGAPTKEEGAAIWKAAKQRGGFSCANSAR